MARQAASNNYTLEDLGDGIYAAIARNGGAAISNAGLVDLGDATLVIDSFLTPTAAEDLRADSERLTGRAPRWVVDTHYHNDHIWGTQAFLPEADVISSLQTRLLIQTAGQEEYDEYRATTEPTLKRLLGDRSGLSDRADAAASAQRAGLDLMIGYFEALARDLPRLRVVLPNVVFKNRMTLFGSRRRAEVIAFTDAHTRNDAVVYLPEDGIVFMSDLLFIDFHSYLGDGSPDHWLAVLRSILDGSAGIQGTTRFVPGHGPAGTRDEVQRLAEYIQQCAEIAQGLVSAGADADAIAAAGIPEAYREWNMPRYFYANLQFLVEQYRHPGAGLMEGEAASRSFRA